MCAPRLRPSALAPLPRPAGEKFYFPYGNWLGQQNPMVEIPAVLQDPHLDRRAYKVRQAWLGCRWQGGTRRDRHAGRLALAV